MGAATLIAPTTERVAQNTADSVNRRIRDETARRLESFHGASPEAIEERLQQLDREWDIERVLEVNMSLVLLASLALGFTTSRKWFGFAGLVGAFFLQHAIQGWCPPVVPWRHAGVRTAQEIDTERTALKALRGDFHAARDPQDALRQAQA